MFVFSPYIHPTLRPSPGKRFLSATVDKTVFLPYNARFSIIDQGRSGGTADLPANACAGVVKWQTRMA